MGQAKAFIKQLQGLTFVGKANSNHWVTMDVSESVGGSDAGIRPKELLLLSIGGCTASDVASILKKKRVKLDGFELNVSADITEEHPKVYQDMLIEYIFYGKYIKEKDVERAIELSQTKYCGVSEMLGKAMDIKHSFKIIDSKEDKS